MSTTTTNYSLVKPELTDAADITAMNSNWDIIDTQLQKALSGTFDNAIPIENGGTGATSRPKALTNLAALENLNNNSPASMSLIYANMRDTGVVSLSCTTKEYCQAMTNYQTVTFVHNTENTVHLTDAPSNYGVCSLFRGYNNNYLVGVYIGIDGQMYKFKSHTTNNANDGWTLVTGQSGVINATVE